VVHDWAVGVDRDAKTVALAGGGSVPYDRLVIAPGIDFKYDGAVPGWDVTAQHKMPHAYKAGSQTELLKAQIETCAGRASMHGRPPEPLSLPARPL
jgi:sulfide dehydrogenase [flavocytochrome c] flavoprotein chain